MREHDGSDHDLWDRKWRGGVGIGSWCAGWAADVSFSWMQSSDLNGEEGGLTEPCQAMAPWT